MQLTILKRHVHAIAGDDGGRAADDHGPIGIPADRIPAREDRKRTEVAEAAGKRRQIRLGAMPAAVSGAAQPTTDVSEPRAHR